MNIHGAKRAGRRGVSIGYGLEVGRSVRTAGGAGAYRVATRTACLRLQLRWLPLLGQT